MQRGNNPLHLLAALGDAFALNWLSALLRELHQTDVLQRAEEECNKVGTKKGNEKSTVLVPSKQPPT